MGLRSYDFGLRAMMLMDLLNYAGIIGGVM